MQYPLAPTTINSILGELGDPNDFEEGTKKTGSIRGQIVKQLSGGEFHEPHIIDYEAKIVRKDDQFDWEILDWRVIA
jgi:hypothetical protein